MDEMQAHTLFCETAGKGIVIAEKALRIIRDDCAALHYNGTAHEADALLQRVGELRSVLMNDLRKHNMERVQVRAAFDVKSNLEKGSFI